MSQVKFPAGAGVRPTLFTSRTIPARDFYCLEGLLSAECTCYLGRGEILESSFLKQNCVGGNFSLDGSYALFERKDSRFFCGTDFFGAKKLYYYAAPGFWLVSTSFSAAVACLRSNGFSIIEDSLWKTARLLRTSIGNQLVSSRTPVSGLKLLPQGSFLDIELASDDMPAQVHVRHSVHACDLSSESDYRSVLAHSIVNAVSDVSSLIVGFSGNPEFDLSGGRDSRLSFSLGIAALSLLGAGDALSVNTNRFKVHELGIVKGLLHKLNIPASSLETSDKPTGPRSFRSWTDFSLGVYRPIYFADIDSWDSRIRFGGGGGEVYRKFYRHSSLSLTFASAFPRHRIHSILGVDMGMAIKELSEYHRMWRDVCSPSDSHYRLYRARFHGARTSEVMGQIQPLLSRAFFRAWYAARKSAIEPLQFYADLLFNLCPEACEVPFDSPSKNIAPRHIKGITDVRSMVRGLLARSSIKPVVRLSPAGFGESGERGETERDCFSLLEQMLSDIDFNQHSAALSISASRSEMLSTIAAKARSPRSVLSTSLMDVHDLLLCDLLHG